MVVAYHSYIKTATEAEKQVALLNGKVSGTSSDSSGHSRKIGIVCRHRIVCVPRGNHWYPELIKQLQQLLARARKANARSNENEGRFCRLYLIKNSFCKLLCDLGHLPGSFLLGNKVSELVNLYLRALNVKRDIQPDRASPALKREIVRLFKMISDISGVHYHHRVLRHIGYRADYIELLISKLTQSKLGTRRGRGFSLYLTRKHEHRDRVEPTAHNSRNGVSSAGTAGNADSRKLARHSRVTLSRHRASLLVVVEYASESLLMSQRIVKVHSSSAGDHKAIGDSLVYQKLRYII